MREITTALIPVLKTRSAVRQIGQYNADHLRYGRRQSSASRRFSRANDAEKYDSDAGA